MNMVNVGTKRGHDIELISVKESPEYRDRAIEYFQSKWASEKSMDLYPWLCALYIEKEYRGNAYASLLFDKAKMDSRNGNFSHLYLCTDHIGYYEKYGFEYIGVGYHPWGESSRIYGLEVNND